MFKRMVRVTSLVGLLALVIFGTLATQTHAKKRPAKTPARPTSDPYSAIANTAELEAIMLSAIDQGKVDQATVDAFFQHTLSQFKKEAPDAPAEIWTWMAAHQEATVDFMLEVVPFGSKPVLAELVYLWKEAPNHVKRYPKLTLAHAHMQHTQGRAQGKKITCQHSFWPQHGDFVGNFKWYVERAEKLPGDVLALPHFFLGAAVRNNLTLDMRSVCVDPLFAKEAKDFPGGPAAYRDLQVKKAKEENIKTHRFPDGTPFIYKGGACGPAAARNVMYGTCEGFARFYCGGTGHAWHLRVEVQRGAKEKQLTYSTNNDLGRRTKNGSASVNSTLPVFLVKGTSDRPYQIEMTARAYNLGSESYAQSRLAAILLGKYLCHSGGDAVKAEKLIKHAVLRNPQAYQLWEVLNHAAEQGKVRPELAMQLREELKTEIDLKKPTGRNAAKLRALKKRTAHWPDSLKTHRDMAYKGYSHGLLGKAFMVTFDQAIKAGDPAAARKIAAQYGEIFYDSFNWYCELGEVPGVYGDIYMQMLQQTKQSDLALKAAEEWLTKCRSYPGGARYGQREKRGFEQQYRQYFASFDGGKESGPVSQAAYQLAVKLEMSFVATDALEKLQGKALRDALLAALEGNNPHGLNVEEVAQALMGGRKGSSGTYGYEEAELRNNDAAYQELLAFRDRYTKLANPGGSKPEKFRINGRFGLYKTVYGNEKAAVYAKKMLEELRPEELTPQEKEVYAEDVATFVWKSMQQSDKYSLEEKIAFVQRLQVVFKDTEIGWAYTQSDEDAGAIYVVEEAKLYLEQGKTDKAFDLFRDFLANRASSRLASTTLFRNVFTGKSRKAKEGWKPYNDHVVALVDWYRKNVAKTHFVSSAVSGQPAFRDLTQVNQAFQFLTKKPLASKEQACIFYNGGKVYLGSSPKKKAKVVLYEPFSDETKVYFTTDGSIPTAASKRYTEPFAFSGTGTIKAICVDQYGDAGIPTTLRIPTRVFPEKAIAEDADFPGIAQFKTWFKANYAKFPGIEVEKVIGTKVRSTAYVTVVHNLKLSGLEEKELFAMVEECHKKWNDLFTKDKEIRKHKIKKVELMFADIHGNKSVMIDKGGSAVRAFGTIR